MEVTVTRVIFQGMMMSAPVHYPGQQYLQQQDNMETEIMFSELRCKKILPTAVTSYTEVS